MQIKTIDDTNTHILDDQNPPKPQPNKQKTQEYQMLVRMWSNRYSHSLWVERKMAQPLWKMVWQFLTKYALTILFRNCALW
jgi:hypothetical protein